MALPAGAERNTHQNYEEFRLPASKSFTTSPWDLVKITDGLDEVHQPAYIEHLYLSVAFVIK